jgi:hypothetical protein
VGAALALPGVAGVAFAETAPTEGAVGFKYLFYRDSQPDLDRVKVSSPSVYALFPVTSRLVIEGSLTIDSLSGATPRWHSSVSSASRMSDRRTAGDVKVTRYFDRAAFGLGAAFSTENDYDSRAVSTDLRISTADNNTTFAFGVGFADDTINSTGGAVVDESKRVTDLLVGVTRVLTRADVIRINLTHSNGRGYFSDPYKLPDNRPRKRDATALLTQWNHHFIGAGASLRTGYRFYSDSYGINAHTFNLDWAQTLGFGWIVTPSLRYHSQGAADFYCEAEPQNPIPLGCFGVPAGAFVSADHRLSAFGGITGGIKISKQIAKLTVDVKFELYEQRADWRLGGEGSPGLQPFRAEMIQFGFTRRF